MNTSHPASLLVAALVMLHHPCPRNRATAQLLLERAAENQELTPPEREACLNLADDLARDHHESIAVRPTQTETRVPRGDSTRARTSSIPAGWLNLLKLAELR